MKTIIAVYNSSGKGKSSTILEMANLLLAIPGCNIIFSSKPVAKLSVDFRLVIEIKGKIITLESQGDPGTHLQNRLDDIVNKHKPDLIFCTCRTRGETAGAVSIVASMHAYDKIWTSTYETKHAHKVVNTLKAEHLLDLVTKLGLI